VLASVGELVEDVVVHVGGLINLASDSAAVITRRRGGSAANVCAAAAWSGGRARFIGQVGDDGPGAMLTASLGGLGVDLVVRRTGRTGTVVVFVDGTGERTMFPDPAASHLLDDPDRAWLDGVDVLHVPVYSLIADPLARTAATLVGWAHEAGARVSVDASSVGALKRFGVGAMVDRVATLSPDVLLANGDEAACLGEHGIAVIAASLTVVKHGAHPAEVRTGGRVIQVAAIDLGPPADTTAAGDAFAAGLLGALVGGADPVEATRAGHHLAARLLTARDRP
jgi:sugar/nucleoside kinase (ribokinase family)